MTIIISIAFVGRRWKVPLDLSIETFPAFRESVCGTLGDRDITFTEGTGTFSGTLLVVSGYMNDTDFRKVGKYTVALVDQSPTCYHRHALGQQVIYQCSVEGQVPMPPEYEDLFQGHALVKVKDGLYA